MTEHKVWAIVNRDDRSQVGSVFRCESTAIAYLKSHLPEDAAELEIVEGTLTLTEKPMWIVVRWENGSFTVQKASGWKGDSEIGIEVRAKDALEALAKAMRHWKM